MANGDAGVKGAAADCNVEKSEDDKQSEPAKFEVKSCGERLLH